MKPTPKRTVEVKIQGREYRIRAEGSADVVRRAAVLLDETMERVRLRAGTVDSVDIAVLAALNIANSLVAERESRSTKSTAMPEGRIAQLVERLEAAVAGTAARSN
jgi:cell division protein ZapA (FtsZ GTPase activity inhibitor)